jgi:hypothetical protein
MRNEISSSKEEGKRPPVMLPRQKARKAPVIEIHQDRKADRADSIEKSS